MSAQTPRSLRAKWKYLSNHPAYRRAPFRTSTRLVLWNIRCRFGLAAEILLQRWNVKMHLPAEWRGIAKLVYSFREMYEPELGLIDRLLQPGGTFIDAGACYGLYSVAASRIVGCKGRVLSIEPASNSFEVLRRNVALNNLQNVTSLRIALGAESASTPLYLNSDSSRNSLGLNAISQLRSEKVEVRRLDDISRELGIHSLQLMKIDVEGAEELVFRGGLATLRAFHPVLIFEINAEAAGDLGLSHTGGWDILRDIGYQFSVVDNGKLKRIWSIPPGGNVIASTVDLR